MVSRWDSKAQEIKKKKKKYKLDFIKIKNVQW